MKTIENIIQVPIILGRTFLRMAKASMDFDTGNVKSKN